MTHEIYIVTNLVNGKIYIGQSKNVSQRWYYHCYDAKRGKGNMAIHKAIKKYGEKNFIIDILIKGVPTNQVDLYETMMITAFESTDIKIGYNIATGGIGGKGLSGSKNGMFGKKRPDLAERNRLGKGSKQSEERKNKTREFHTGRKNTEATKKKMSETRKALFDSGKISMTGDIKRKISESKTRRPYKTNFVLLNPVVN